MQGFRQRCPEIPIVQGTSQIGARIPLDRMIEIRKFQRIAQKKTGVLFPTKSQFPCSV
jgi:hypothetical protein